MGIIAIWNLLIFSDFVQNGLANGNRIGSVVRYIDARRHIEDYNFVLVPSDQYPLDSENRAYWWQDWIDFITPDDHYVHLIDIDSDVEGFSFFPVTIFISEDYWVDLSESFSEMHPDRIVHDLMADGSFLEIEVAGAEYGTFGQLRGLPCVGTGEQGP